MTFGADSFDDENPFNALDDHTRFTKKDYADDAKLLIEDLTALVDDYSTDYGDTDILDIVIIKLQEAQFWLMKEFGN